jgi:hypothetical protein
LSSPHRVGVADVKITFAGVPGDDPARALAFYGEAPGLVKRTDIPVDRAYQKSIDEQGAPATIVPRSRSVWPSHAHVRFIAANRAYPSPGSSTGAMGRADASTPSPVARASAAARAAWSNAKTRVRFTGSTRTNAVLSRPSRPSQNAGPPPGTWGLTVMVLSLGMTVCGRNSSARA